MDNLLLPVEPRIETNPCKVGPFPLLTAREIESVPDRPQIVAGIFGAGELACCLGPPGAGKTSLLLKVAADIALGRLCFGYSTTKSRTIFVALEGVGGLKRRLMAWSKFNGMPYPDGVKFMTKDFSLISETDVNLLVHQIKQCGSTDVVIIDTMSRAAPGADENAHKDMSKIIAGASLLQKDLRALVILSHHPGKDESRGARGHSSLRGAVDVEIRIGRNGDTRYWTVDKSRDWESGAVHHFRLQKIDLGESSTGQPLSSCIVVPTDPIALPEEPKKPKGKNQCLVYEAVREYLVQQRLEVIAGDREPEDGVSLEVALSLFTDVLSHVSSKHSRIRLKEALAGLVEDGFLNAREGKISLPGEGQSVSPAHLGSPISSEAHDNIQLNEVT